MTLTTEMYVLDEINPQEVFGEVRRLLGATYPAHPYTDSADEDGYDGWTIEHPPGIGLEAWAMLRYKPGKPLRTAEEIAAHDCPEPDMGDCEEYHLHYPACWLSIWLDTAYGGNPTRVHARLVAELGRWLDDRGIRWSWKNEYDGAIFGGEDRYTSLTRLLDDGEAGEKWFADVVKPLIEREIGGEI